ncbi:dimethylarginine dimethylaminohydrolase family protein [Halobaculum lipolyticum]|uniref:Dimethylarginine dimethylaminohydrolase family protein n=1 Tax=Halobaculum lipolyticum TaxID=3032001 RepID=A0ABD5WC98_9EURY|nr:arginine deiminase-related protein [Halobaculum sp. DT31]
MSTIDGTVYDDRTPPTLDRTALPRRPDHATVLLVAPTYFDVRYRINPYMGGVVDGARARSEWDRLRRAYERYAERVVVLDPDRYGTPDPEESGRDHVAPARLPDLVFAANLGLATADGDGVVLARMATAERAAEPVHFARWCRAVGYDVHELPGEAAFEGTGDAIWHPGRRLLWGGYGVRTERAAYDEIAPLVDAPVVPLELADERFYHLDVCFAPLTEETVLIVPEAFDAAGRDRIDALFERVIEAPLSEATDGLACNCHCVDGRHVLLGAGNPETERRLRDAGFVPVPVSTAEFRKAGGSVRCLSLSLG